MTQYTYQERFRTEKGVFDEFTKRNLFVLQSKGAFEELQSPLKVGKESNVFTAVRHDEKSKESQPCIVKIYRVQNCDFTKMYGYIQGDPRYSTLKRQRRQIIFAWTQREYKNLMRSYAAGVRVPKPLAFRSHILVEEFVGDELEGGLLEAAPPLKDATPKDPQGFFEQLVEQMKLLYHKAGLVHGDLSSFNILNYQEEPILIDFSQATLLKSPRSRELLERDCKNLSSYFKKLGVDCDAKRLYAQIVARS